MEAKEVELTEIKDGLLNVFNVKTIDEIFEPMFQSIICCDNQIYRKYVQLVQGDLSRDYLQKVYQYYSADRENLGQDYTPATLGKLLGTLTHLDDIVDLCAGSGALTIQAWNINPDRKFICYEMDGRAITFLLFNLCVRNIVGYVYHQNIFNTQHSKIYQLTKGAEYSLVQEVSNDGNH